MPVFVCSPENPFGDIFAVEGEFVRSFLAETPSDYVKVYIYCLYSLSPSSPCANLKDIAKGTGQTVEQVKSALEYFANEMLLRVVSERPLSIEIRSVREAARLKAASAPAGMMDYADYFASLRAILGGRELKPAEMEKARDWIEVYCLPQDVAVLMASHCLNNLQKEGKSARSPFNYMDKVAHSWAENHITTMEAAERYLTIYELEHHDVNQVMLHLGIKRMPSIEELKLYQKWTGEWGLSKEAILQACSQTVKTATPSFGYLDKIVEKLYNKGNSSEEEVKETLSEEAQQRAEASEVLKELGLKGITPELLEAVSAFKAMGFDMNALLLAARETARKPVRSLEKYIQLLDELASQKLFDTESIKKYLKQSKKPSVQKKTSAHQFDERTKSDYDDVIIDL